MKNHNFLSVYLIKYIRISAWKNIFLLLPTVLLFGNVLPENQSNETVLAKIGSKEITVKEFLERSELTIRPNNFKDKYITLNNLISEKILALEAEQNKKISENPVFEGTLKGIKEQAMRDKLYDKIAFGKIKLDSAELKNAYKASLREYELEFYTIKNKELASNIEAVIDTVPELGNEIFKELESIIGKKPVRKISFKDKEDDVIHESLFSNPLDTAAVIGPLKLTNGDYIVMKVLNWVDHPIIGGEEQAEQWYKVKQTMHEIKARKVWLAYQTGLMRGKKFEFDKNAFNALADVAMDYYLSKAQNDSLNQLKEIPLPKPDIDPSAPFFTVANKSWTVDDFRKELLVHPLVFRTKNLDKNNFKRQFQLAVVDMMRDYYLAQEAYKDLLDKSEDISKAVGMWKDSFFATAEMNNVIKSALDQGIISKEDNIGMLKYKESYLVNLQKKYSGSVYINYKELDKISLTQIDFLAVRSGVPFPIAIPNFPILIRSENLDYAKKQ